MRLAFLAGACVVLSYVGFGPVIAVFDLTRLRLRTCRECLITELTSLAFSSEEWHGVPFHMDNKRYMAAAVANTSDQIKCCDTDVVPIVLWEGGGGVICRQGTCLFCTRQAYILVSWLQRIRVATCHSFSSLALTNPVAPSLASSIE
jgi:hypothetical protein